jgi:hypothetical protein
VHGDRILVGLRMSEGATAADPQADVERWQVLTVSGGRVTSITGFGERGEAAAHARRGPASERA